MKATADHWININGKWYAPGEEYEIDVTPAGDDTPDEPSGGGELPAVTADDNGDVLTVVDGSWAKAAPSGGGGGGEPLVFEMDSETSKSNVTAAQVKAALLAGTPVIERTEGDDRLQYAPITEYAESISDGSVTGIYVQFGGSAYVANASDEEFGYTD